MEIHRVPIQKLRRHEGYKSYGATMAKTDYLLRDPGLIQPEAIEVVLETLPIVAIRQGRSWEYISGHRTFIVAGSVLGVEAQVPIRVIRNPGAQRIRLYIAADIMASSIITGISRKSDLGELLTELRRRDNVTHEKLFVASTQKTFASALSATKETVFRSRKARR
ncbi:hypothetical protein [Trichloromonas acetexigens]|uniref:Uncharacterized protein n=1 Tax=Trichloromonas acetexigens TaxID=38815 RepID=A0A550JH87_9BACT|nr:hypothetical protein [Desulfuromonas acetexigens]TRO82566.1 hypothetical protein FL622_05080 [Desulfuromonas acetexigens]